MALNRSPEFFERIKGNFISFIYLIFFWRFQRRRISNIFFMSIQCEYSPFARAMFIDASKFHEHLLKKGHPKNISVKIFQDLTSGFREDFLRISSCPYSANCPIHVYRWIKILQAIFEEGHKRHIYVKLFQILNNVFRGEDFFKNFFLSI